MTKIEKCQVRYCRNTPDKMSGVMIYGKWMCDKCWDKHCDGGDKNGSTILSEESG